MSWRRTTARSSRAWETAAAERRCQQRRHGAARGTTGTAPRRSRPAGCVPRRRAAPCSSAPRPSSSPEAVSLNEVRSRGERCLRGFDSAIERVRVGVADRRRRAAACAGGRRHRHHGRAPGGARRGKRAVLDTALAGGASRTLLVVGEPGIGKTCLVAAVAQTASAMGFTVARWALRRRLARSYQPVVERSARGSTPARTSPSIACSAPTGPSWCGGGPISAGGSSLSARRRISPRSSGGGSSRPSPPWSVRWRSSDHSCWSSTTCSGPRRRPPDASDAPAEGPDRRQSLLPRCRARSSRRRGPASWSRRRLGDRGATRHGGHSHRRTCSDRPPNRHGVTTDETGHDRTGWFGGLAVDCLAEGLCELLGEAWPTQQCQQRRTK